jgi:reactive intermediate/imine deaminase
MKKEVIPFTADLGAEVAFSQAIKVDKAGLSSLLFISGQASIDKNGNLVGKGDIKAQTRQTLENMKAALAQLGGIMDDVVKVTVYVTDMSKFKEIHEVRREFFSKENYPASTIVEINRLANDDLLIEIDAIAVV